MGFPIKRRIVCDDGAGRAPCGLDLLSAVIDARPELAERAAARNGRPQDRGAAIASSSSASAASAGGDASDGDGRDGVAPSPASSSAAAAAPPPDPSSLPPAASANERRVVGAGAAGRIEEFAVQLRTELMLRELQRRGGEGVLGRDRARVLLRFLREMTPLTDSDVASRYIAEKLRRRALERRRRAQRGIATRRAAFSERDASHVIVEESKCGNGNE